MSTDSTPLALGVVAVVLATSFVDSLFVVAPLAYTVQILGATWLALAR